VELSLGCPVRRVEVMTPAAEAPASGAASRHLPAEGAREPAAALFHVLQMNVELLRLRPEPACYLHNCKSQT